MNCENCNVIISKYDSKVLDTRSYCLKCINELFTKKEILDKTAPSKEAKTFKDVLSTMFGIFCVLYMLVKALNYFDLIPTTEQLADTFVEETYHEVVIPKKYFSDYSAERMKILLTEFGTSEAFEEVKPQIKETILEPEVTVDLYQDTVENQSELGWVIRFTVSTSNVGYDRAKKVAEHFGNSFVIFLNRYKK